MKNDIAMSNMIKKMLVTERKDFEESGDCVLFIADKKRYKIIVQEEK